MRCEPVAPQTFHHRQTLVRAGKHLSFSDFDFGDRARGLALLCVLRSPFSEAEEPV
jgi:hypothetical protein